MCKKRERIALVSAIAGMSGKEKGAIRKLIADSARLARRTCKECEVPMPQHLVENLCVTFVSMDCRADTPRELTQSTLSFLGMFP